MNIVAAIIGMGIGQKHFEAIEGYKNSKVKIICEKDQKKIKLLKKKYPNKIITQNENDIYLDKNINLVSIASYDEYHFKQIIKCFKFKKNFIVEKPMCMNEKQLKIIKNYIDKYPEIKMTSNLVLRVNSLFNNFKKNLSKDKIFYIEGDYIWGRKHKLFGWRSLTKEFSLIKGAGIHLIDLIMWLTNMKPHSVYTLGNKNSTKGTIFKKESFIVMLFKFPKNIIVKITANGGAIYDHFHELKIFSSNQTMVNSRLGVFSQNSKSFKKESFLYPDKKNRKKLIHNFLDCIIDKKTKPLIKFKEMTDAMSVCFAAENSLKQKKEIKIKYI